MTERREEAAAGLGLDISATVFAQHIRGPGLNPQSCREEGKRKAMIRGHMDSSIGQKKKKQQNPCISPLVVPRKGPPKEGGNPFPLLAPATFLPHQLLTQEQGLSPGGCSLTQTSLSRQQQEAGASNTPITHR